MRERFEIRTGDQLDVVDVTDRIDDLLASDAEGACTVFVRHTTAGISVNEAESRLLDDVESFLGGVVPDEGWAHDRLDDNADSHLRALLLGPGETLPVSGGELDLGTWQSVLLIECDGPRTRAVDVVW